MSCQKHRCIRFEKPCLVALGDGSEGNGGRRAMGHEAQGAQCLGRRKAVADGGRRVLIFAAYVEAEAPCMRAGAIAGKSVESWLKGTAVIVHHGLPEMVA